ncbi:hypothetical protein KR009_006115 [Drosophila setifemur]|nr:hypothetical protein KR009_006115 [Drosophila setifemur]
MGLPVFKDCCCLELKWGALIVAIVDLILGAVYLRASNSCNSCSNLPYIMWICAVVFNFAHFVGIILVIVAVFVPNKNLVICYLITGIIRFIFNICLMIYLVIKYGFSDDPLISFIIILIYTGLAVYFWLVVYSYYRKLGGSTPAD